MNPGRVLLCKRAQLSEIIIWSWFWILLVSTNKITQSHLNKSLGCILLRQSRTVPPSTIANLVIHWPQFVLVAPYRLAPQTKIFCRKWRDKAPEPEQRILQSREVSHKTWVLTIQHASHCQGRSPFHLRFNMFHGSLQGICDHMRCVRLESDRFWVGILPIFSVIMFSPDTLAQPQYWPPSSGCRAYRASVCFS